MPKTSTLTEKKQYPLLDILKFIMSILVITLHRPLGDDSTLFIHLEQKVIASLAVPFFFATSSFLFFTKRESVGNSENIIKPYLLRLFRLFLIWNLLYLPQNLYRQYLSNGGLKFNAFSSLITCFLKSGGFFHLWFIPSLAFSVLICYFFSEKSKKGFLVVSSLLFIISIISNYTGFMTSYTGIITNTLFRGIPYTFLGYVVTKTKFKCKKKTLIIVLTIFIVLALLEGLIDFKYIQNINCGISRLSYIPIIYALIALSALVDIKPKKIYVLLRKSSMLIYYTHVIFYQEIIVIIFSILGLEKYCYNYIPVFIFTISYIAAICFAVLFLENKKGFKFLKKIY